MSIRLRAVGHQVCSLRRGAGIRGGERGFVGLDSEYDCVELDFVVEVSW